MTAGPSAAAAKIAFVVAPSGAEGGGMGRVKDYILAAGGDAEGRVRLEPLVTRDHRGFVASLGLTAGAVGLIWRARLAGRLAFVHVNLGDKASAVRKGVVALLTRAAGGTVVVHLHAVRLMQAYEAGGGLRRWLIALPFRVASTNIVLGELWRRWLVEDLKVAPAKVDILANGVPMPPYAPRDHLAPRAAVRLLFLGNLLERKGVADLIEALAALPQDLPAWRAIFAGGGDVERYKALANARGLIDRAEFLGWVGQDEARALLAGADALVLPSYDEGLPLVILEALGAGTPVICTPVGAVPEFLEGGRTALFVPPGDRPALGAALARVIAEPPLRQSLGDEGRASYEKTFSLAAFQRALFDIYRRRIGVDITPAI
jgi:glycosyltransferase involved in cell wall biosynthesis